MKFNIFNRLFSKYKTTQDYQIKFRASFPLANGHYQETEIIRITIPANNKEHAKEKLNQYFKERIKCTVVGIDEIKGSATKSRLKTPNPSFN